jgi:alpha-beta hydrolase superfamily lysophospholipase
MHGLGEYTSRWTPVGLVLAEAGYRVHCIDFPGHGRTSGCPPGHMGGFDVIKTFIELLLSFDKSSEKSKFIVTI